MLHILEVCFRPSVIDAQVVELVNELSSEVPVCYNGVLRQVLEPLPSRADEHSREAATLLDIATPRLSHGIVIRGGVVYGIHRPVIFVNLRPFKAFGSSTANTLMVNGSYAIFRGS